jgi:two-component system nitrogen regulation sensor histidine kinase GlnL
LDSLEIGVVVLDQKGVLILANDSARQLLPVTPPIPSDISILDMPQGYPEVREIVRCALQEGKFSNEVEKHLGFSESAGTVRISMLPLRKAQRKVGGILLLINDVSEEVSMQRRMRNAERLSTMGTLAAALAHEIRNPLEALNLNLELLNRGLKQIRVPASEGEKIGRYVRIFDSEVSRLAGIVENFLSFARPSNFVSGNVRLDEILRQVSELIENQAASRNVSISLDIKAKPMIVQGFEDHLKQLFLNLIINGLKAMREGGKLSIHGETVTRLDSEPPVSLAVVSIQDTGEGIPAEEIGRLFKPFYSTRSRGTGLGLTIANRIADEHKGQIRVESAPGKGSTFVVELPLLT